MSAVGKESFVDVSGPSSIDELAAAVAAILNEPAGPPDQDGYIPIGPANLVQPAEQRETGGFAFTVALYTGGHADEQGRAVFDELARSTPWSLRLLNDGYGTIAVRPALAHTT